MGRKGRNAPVLQSAEIYPSSPPYSQPGNNSNDQLAAIDLPLDLNSPALSEREIEGANIQEGIEDDERHNRLMLRRVTEDLDFDDRAQLVSISPPSSPQALQVRTELMEEEALSSFGHTRSPIISR
jgi:hypothetical protein